MRGDCEAIASSFALDTWLSGSTINVIGSALIGVGTNVAGYYLTNPCRTLGAGSRPGLRALWHSEAARRSEKGPCSRRRRQNWHITASLAYQGGWALLAEDSTRGYLAANVDGPPTAPGLITQGLIGAAGAYLTNPLILALLG